MKPRLIVEQKITAFANQYRVYEASAEGEKGSMVAFAHQKRLAFKEKVEFFTSEEKNQLAFTMRAEKVMDIHGKFLVEDPDGKLVGVFRKEFKQSLLISTWSILGPGDTIKLQVAESNVALAVIRRFAGWIPVIGELIDILVMFFRYHFNFIDASGQVVGKYQKTTLFRDHYRLSMTDEAYSAEDQRTLAAVAVALDALQGR